MRNLMRNFCWQIGFRKRLLCLGSGLFIFAIAINSSAQAQDFGFRNPAENLSELRVVDLKIQLSKGLRVVNASQQAFVDRVVLEVNNKRISRSMVNYLYVWALERNPSVPFPYFEFAMRALAGRRGVSL